MHGAHVCPFATATAIQTFPTKISHFPYSKLVVEATRMRRQQQRRRQYIHANLCTFTTRIHTHKHSVSLQILLVEFRNRANYVYLLNYGKFDTRYFSAAAGECTLYTVHSELGIPTDHGRSLHSYRAKHASFRKS